MTVNATIHVGRESIIEVERDVHKNEPIVRFIDRNNISSYVTIFFDDESFGNLCRQVDHVRNAVTETTP